MASIDDLRQRLRRPLERERSDGCRDALVVGGLEKLVDTVGRPFADVREVMRGYGALEPWAREERLEQALTLLEQPRLGEGFAPGAPSDERRAPEAERPGGLSLDELEREITAKAVDLGAQAPKKLAQIGLRSYRELLYHFPRRYEDRRALPYFSNLTDGDAATVSGLVTGRKLTRSRRGMTVVRAFLEDSLGARLTAVWFNQPWLEKQLFPGQRLIITGKVKRRGRLLEVNVSHHEIDEDKESLSAGRIVGIYPSTQGLSQSYLRRAAHRLLAAVPTFPDHLPKTVLERQALVSLDAALREIHFPSDEKALAQAIRRLKFDEFLFLELRVLLNRDTTLLGKRFTVQDEDLATFEASLPFAFTGAQRRALREILADMAGDRQMARLLQGDVGSGKTAVAAAAMYIAVKNGYQAALMAPTEILARQHYLNFLAYLYPLGLSIELLTGAMSPRERREVRERLRGAPADPGAPEHPHNSQVDLVVGTHALIQEGVEFRDLGLAVIDEEHRFGVDQRRKLLSSMPDVLVMSATPIPRSLALTYYGDLELSIIDELPPGRKPITTKLVNDSKRREVYRFAWGEIRKGRQVYLVTPLIEESEALDGIVSTTRMFDDLRAIMPQGCRTEMLHGKMPGTEKDKVMERFRRHDFDLLVSTTVIEVGVDIPNASLMIIENAERFGLSQLHQLRGRVGRGEFESTCVLIAGDRSKKTQSRLGVIEKHSDGFVIAEKDLELRGPGELRGTRQSGLPDLVLGDLASDGDIIEKARELAVTILDKDPKLEAAWAQRLKGELQKRVEAVGFREII
ncbi:MAG: ATP-dependent DNA helicase RecG [Deinococcota bacterium]|nr:ATP-dependent DNA helicase RecG [Deinococcota bacterium]